MNCKIAVIRGDGIGPEVIDAAIGCLDAVARRFGHSFDYDFLPLGGEAIDSTGVPLPRETVEACQRSGAVLLGPVGGPKWNNLAGHLRPEKGLLNLRSALGLYANVRPMVLYDQLRGCSPLKPTVAKKGVNLIVVRELTGGIYYGPRGYRNGKNGHEAYDTEVYSMSEIERIAKVAFEIAQSRGKKVTSIDKANVLETGRLWSATVERVSQDYPDVKLEHMLVDKCVMQLIGDPSQFDVILCPNMFGDIISHEAAMVTGSIGLIPGSCLGADKLGLYGPIHGSAPDIADTDTANPIATILAAAMMLSSSFGLTEATQAIERSVNAVLDKGYRTADIFEQGNKKVSCSKMGELIALEIFNN